MSHINEESILGTLAGGSLVAFFARMYINRILRDIEHSITSIKVLENEVMRLQVKLEVMHDKKRD